MLMLRSKTVMRTATASLWLLSAGMFVWAFRATAVVPEPSSPRAPPTNAASARNGELAESEVVPKGWDSLFTRRFQDPLFDPPVEAPPAAVEKVIPPPPIEVVATIAENGGGSAFIRDEKGVISAVSIGGTITAGGTTARLLNVYDDRIELQHEGRVITVVLNTNKKE